VKRGTVPSQRAVPDRHALYELCAQNPARDARMLRALHAGEPRVLGEDFSGTGAISRAWAGLFPGARAVAVDHDPEVLARARGAPGVKAVCADVMRVRERVDVIGVLNFSICELHDRARLVAYLAHARARLRRAGVFVADIYDGSDAFATGVVSQRVRLPGRGPARFVRYQWEQRHADPTTGRVVNAMHFTLPPTASRPRERLQDAFVYDWRLWSVPELRDAMAEAGYAATEVFARTADATDADGNLYASPVQDARELGDSFAAYVVGRA
jgi:SAM-dependent methyltransferase